MTRRICCFGSSSPRTPQNYCDAAAAVGRLLAEHGFIQRNGAGEHGCMGALTDAALQAGGLVEGVILQQFVDQQLQHPDLQNVIVVDTMRERKRMLGVDVSGFVVLPGGPGTWEECWEVVVERQINVHHSPVILVNTDGFYDGFVNQLQRADTEGFLYGPSSDLMSVIDHPEELLPLLSI